MKKFLSLVLALVMTMSLVTVAGAKDFTDADDVTYTEAVDVISALGVVGGYADGSFGPNGQLTRGAAAKIICNILVGPETAATLVANTAPFADVAADNVFAGYIAYCVNEGIISGYADGTFRPAAPLTGYAFMKMLLGVVGYNTAVYTGTNWAINVAQDVVKADLDDDLVGKFNGNKVVTREEACLFAFNALKAERMTFDAGDKITIGDIEITSNASNVVSADDGAVMELYFPELLQKKNIEDVFGRAAHEWYIDDNDNERIDSKDTKVGTYVAAADYTYVNTQEVKDIKDELKDADVAYGDVLDAFTSGKYFGKNGNVYEFYLAEDDLGDEYVDYIVEIPTFLAVVEKVEDTDKKSTDYDDRYVQLDLDGKTYYIVADEDNEKKTGVEVDNFDALLDLEEDDYVLLVLDLEGEIYSVEIPTVEEVKISRVVTGKSIVADGEAYLLAYGVDAATGTREIVYGENGVVYAVEGVDSDLSDVIFVDKIFDDQDKWGDWTYTAQIVNEDNEIVEVTLAQEDEDEKKIDVTKYAEREFYTYELIDDEYILTVAKMDGEIKKDIKDDDIRADGEFFADDVTFVYIEESGKKLEVTVKEGVQDVTIAKVAAVEYLLNDDDDIALVYVLGEFEDITESEDIIFVADTEADASVTNDDGKSADAYEVYYEGDAIEIMVNSGMSVGFKTYSVDEKTGEYDLKAVKDDECMVRVALTKGIIEKGKYVSVGKLVDYVLADDAEIYDLTDEGLDTLKALQTWVEDGETALTISFMYDAEEEEITLIYVEEAPVVEA